MSTIAQTSLIPLWTVTVSRGSESAVDARDLHRTLEVGKDFSTWIKDQIHRGSFTKGEDFTAVTKKGDAFINDLAGLRPGLDYTVEYYLTLEMAKHIAMMSGCAKGKEVRNYFLACEKQLKASLPDFSNPAAAARAWADAHEAKELALAQSRALAQQLETEKPYIELAHAITGSSTMIVRDWIALMKEDYNITLKEKQVHGFLHERKYWYWTQLSPRASRAYAEYDHLFKLEKELINGAYREVLKITGEGIQVLTPIVIAHFDASRLRAEN